MRIWICIIFVVTLLRPSFTFQPIASPLYQFQPRTACIALGSSPKFLSEDDTTAFGENICRLVASSDGKLPATKSTLPEVVQRPPFVLDKLDHIYHSLSHEETRRLEYMEKSESTLEASDDEEEQRLVSVLRTSLEDAGFQRLKQRDLDLCEGLNVGYLLRLSIQPDVSKLDPCIAKEFYPELMTENKTFPELLFDGRVLVYRRGYSSEKNKGKMLLPKLDYLQASLVQESAYKATQQLGKVERMTIQAVSRTFRAARVGCMAALDSFSGSLRPAPLKKFFRERLGWKRLSITQLKEEIRKTNSRENVFFKLARYGGSKIRFVGAPNMNNALSSFLICQLNDGDESSSEISGLSELSGPSTVVEKLNHDIYLALNKGEYSCQYDAEHPDRHHTGPMPSTLLERVSIGNLIDVFTSVGRRRMLRNFFAKVELVEPTYEEVIVIWRPLRKKTKAERQVKLPKALYDMAEIFDMEHKLPEKPDPKLKPRSLPLEIRAFNGVPMANLPGVFPKTRLVFRPADAFLFDLISVFTLFVVLGSQRFDNPRLDLLAIISVSLWIIRTVIRYSNKLARYDLLVKKFLTSKIAHRDGGAIKYISDEAAAQRSTRAALLHSWLRKGLNQNLSKSREVLIEQAFVGVNQMLENDQFVDIDIDAGLRDLEALELISFAGHRLLRVADDAAAVSLLKSVWANQFEGDLTGMASERNHTIAP